MIIAVDLERIAAAAFAEAQRHAPRTPERRTAAHLYAALTVLPVASSAAAVRDAIASFGAPEVQAAALDLLYQLAATMRP